MSGGDQFLRCSYVSHSSLGARVYARASLSPSISHPFSWSHIFHGYAAQEFMMSENVSRESRIEN
jgi:hypothetical protein